MKNALKQIAIATVAVGTFSFAASFEAMYRDFKRSFPDLTSRKDMVVAFTKTVEQAVNYQRATGLQMTNAHAMDLIKDHITALNNAK